MKKMLVMLALFMPFTAHAVAYNMEVGANTCEDWNALENAARWHVFDEQGCYDGDPNTSCFVPATAEVHVICQEPGPNDDHVVVKFSRVYLPPGSTYPVWLVLDSIEFTCGQHEATPMIEYEP